MLCLSANPPSGLIPASSLFWNAGAATQLTDAMLEKHMPSSRLKLAESGLALIREKVEIRPEISDRIEELVEALRAVERRLVVLERRGRSIPVQDRD